MSDKPNDEPNLSEEQNNNIPTYYRVNVKPWSIKSIKTRKIYPKKQVYLKV